LQGDPDKGPMPTYLGRGASFAGPIVYVGDGDSLCVGVGSGPQAWVEVRLADFYAPELKYASGDGPGAVFGVWFASRDRELCRGRGVGVLRSPVPGQQLVDAAGRMAAEPADDVGEVSLG